MEAAVGEKPVVGVEYAISARAGEVVVVRRRGRANFLSENKLVKVGCE